VESTRNVYLLSNKLACMKEIKDRVAQSRRDMGLTQQELAKRVGVSQQAVQQLEDGVIKRPRYMVELALALGVSAEWLLNGKGLQRPASNNHETENSLSGDHQVREPELKWGGPMEVWDSKSPLDDDEVELPLFREVELSAGSGRTEVRENHGAKLKFAKSSLRRAGVTPENAACAFVSGDSMARELPDGSTVGVDTSDTQIRDGKLYALDHDGMLRVKQVHRLPGGGLRLVSFNDEYPDEEYTVDQVAEAIRVIGRVFWSAAFW